MEDHSFLSSFDDNDVIEFGPDNVMRIRKLREAIITVFDCDIESNFLSYLSNRSCKIPPSIQLKDQEDRPYNYYNKFLNQGVHCEILKLGNQKWQKGKIKIKVSVEFEPDEPEITEPPSPLDDIRKEINQ